MAKKLYLVVGKYYVVAEDEDEAKMVRDSFDDADEVYEVDSVDSDWWDAIPYGSDDDKTCGQIIAEKKAHIKPC